MATIELVDLHHPNRVCRVRLWGLNVSTAGAIGHDGHVATNHAKAVADSLSPNQIVRLHVQTPRMFDEAGNLLWLC